MSIFASFPRSGYLSTYTHMPPPVFPSPIPAPWITHPGVSAEDGTAKSVTDLAVYNGVLFVAHGDDGQSGRHYIATVDLSTDTPEVGRLVNSEGFLTALESGGRVLLPWSDPTVPWGSPEQGYSYTDDGGASWQDAWVGPAYHFFDMAEHDGALWLAGSGPAADGTERGVVWRSTDGGATWARSLEIAGDTLPRFRALMIADTLYVNLWNGSPYAWDSMAEEWFATSAPVPQESPIHMVNAAGVSYGPNGAFDGVRLVPYPATVIPCWADSTHVYGLNMTDCRVERAPLLAPTDTEVTWSSWLPLGDGMGAHTITTATLHDGFVYVGGTQGRIWRYPAP